MIKLVFYLVLLSVSTSLTMAQAWMRGIDSIGEKSSKEISFYEIQKAFNTYWQDRAVEKGKGYKQFRRWEYFMEPRVYPSGKIDNLAYQKAYWNKINNKTTDKALPAWENLGPSITPFTIDTENKTGNGRINCIAFHPNNQDILYAGAPSGGFWKSKDGGNSWHTTTDQLSSIGVSDIVVDHTIPDHIYLATGDGDHRDTYGIGIVKSVDAGETWQPTSLSLEAADYIYFRRILMNPENHNIMIATSNIGIYKTVNGWSSYNLTLEGNFRDIEFHPANPGIIYATSYSSSGNSKIYRSVNGGDSFIEIMQGINDTAEFNRIELAVTPAEPNSIYALISDNLTDGLHALYKSTDQGLIWEIVYGQDAEHKNLLGWRVTGMDQGGQGWYDLSLSVSPTDPEIIMVGGVNLWKSSDGGASWNLSGLWYHDEEYNYVHADHHMLVYSPLNGKLYCGNDGGVYHSSNHGDSWTDISDGLEILQSYRIGISQTEDDMLLSGNQDNGTFLLKENTWQEVFGADGMECIIDPVNPDILYSSRYYGNIFKSVDGGLTFSPIKPFSYLSGNWVTPYVMSNQYHEKLLVGYEQIFKTVNGGASWDVISEFDSLANIAVIRIAPSNDKYIYASDWNRLYKTDDEGGNWKEINGNLPDIVITDIAISEHDPNKIWVSGSGYDAGEKVFYSPDGGESWINYSQGLPNVPSNCLFFHPNSNQQLYLGTDMGIFHRNAEMDNWEAFNGNLPNVIVSELELHENSNTLYAGTFGRGIWKTTLPDTFQISSTAIKTNITEACLNAEVMFVLLSDYEQFDSINWEFGMDAFPQNESGADTAYVSYSSPGLKNVTIRTYQGGIMQAETYVGLVKVVEGIEFEVFPNQLFNCLEETSEIFITGNYTLSFDPPELVNQTSENTAIVDLVGSAVTINASHGSCTNSYLLEITGTPDNICEAQIIQFGNNGPFSNLCGTPEINEPVPPEGSGSSAGCYSQSGWCQGESSIENSVWFKFVIDNDYPAISIETEGFDNQIAVYKANSCQDILDDNYTLLAANDDFHGKYDYSATIESITGISPGDTLWLQVDGSYGGSTGVFSITLNDHAIVNTDNVPHISESPNVKVFPNPSSGSFTVQIHDLFDDQVKIEVLDVSGKVVSDYNYENAFSPFSARLKLESTQKGLYMVKITTNKQVIIRKIVIQ